MFTREGEALLFIRWGGKQQGQMKSDNAKKGGVKFWANPEGGAIIFGQLPKGGWKILDLIKFFNVLKHILSCFGHFGGFFVHVTKGGRGKKFWHITVGGCFGPQIVLDSLRANKYALEKLGENKVMRGVIAIFVISCPPTH